MIPANQPVTRDEMLPHFKKARIPGRYYDTKFADLDEPGEIIRTYLGNTGQYQNDCDDNRGVTLVGGGSIRNALFPAFARSLVLRHDRVLYMQLSDAADYLDNPDDASAMIDQLYQIPALFLDCFYDGVQLCPYEKREMRRIEALVRDRINNNRRLYVSTDRTAQHMEWYTGPLRELILANNRTITV